MRKVVNVTSSPKSLVHTTEEQICSCMRPGGCKQCLTDYVISALSKADCSRKFDHIMVNKGVNCSVNTCKQFDILGNVLVCFLV